MAGYSPYGTYAAGGPSYGNGVPANGFDYSDGTAAAAPVDPSAPDHKLQVKMLEMQMMSMHQANQMQQQQMQQQLQQQQQHMAMQQQQLQQQQQQQAWAAGQQQQQAYGAPMVNHGAAGYPYQQAAPPAMGVPPPGYQLVPVPVTGVQQPGATQTGTTNINIQQGPVVAATTTTGTAGTCSAGGAHIFKDNYTVCGWILAILFFPLGVLCCLASAEERCIKCDQSAAAVGYSAGYRRYYTGRWLGMWIVWVVVIIVLVVAVTQSDNSNNDCPYNDYYC